MRFETENIYQNILDFTQEFQTIYNFSPSSKDDISDLNSFVENKSEMPTAEHDRRSESALSSELSQSTRDSTILNAQRAGNLFAKGPPTEGGASHSTLNLTGVNLPPHDGTFASQLPRTNQGENIEQQYPSDDNFSVASPQSEEERFLDRRFDQQKNQHLFICKACQANMTSMNNYRAHIKGAGHRKKVQNLPKTIPNAAAAPRTAVLRPSPVSNSAISFHGPPVNIDQPRQPTPQQVPAEPRQSPARASYRRRNPVVDNILDEAFGPAPHQDDDLDSNYDLSGFSDARSVMSGRSRRSKAPAAFSAKCFICHNEIFSDREQVTAHFQSQPHQTKLRERRAQFKKPQNFSQPNVLICFTCPGAEFADEKFFHEHLKTPDHVTKSKSLDGLFISCIVCGVNWQTDDYLNHLESQEHHSHLKFIIDFVPGTGG